MDRKSDSKSNLNESTLPLLEDEANKEKIELETKASTEVTEEKVADAAQEDAVDAAKKKKEEEKERKRQLKLEEEEKKKQQKLEKQKKKDEEKEQKKKDKAEKVELKKAAQEAAKANGTGTASGNGGQTCRNWTTYTSPFTAGLNLLDRDEHSINQHVNVNFEDIIGEPDAAQGFDWPYSTSFGTFHFVRYWLYRILMAILSVPFALLWAVVFALLSLLSVWVLTPAFRVLDILLYFVHRLWNAWVRTFLDPIFTSISLVRKQETTPVNHTPSPSHSGKAVLCTGGKYNQLSTSETVASYTKTEDGDQIALNMQNN